MSVVLRGEAARDVRCAGGKAAALAQLGGAFDVPAFFVIDPAAFDQAGVKAPARGEIEAAIVQLGAGPFAVRSSGVEEDGAASAHAGQFETELNVAAGDVLSAAARVWRSGFSETLAAYRKTQGLSGAAQPPAVIVQIMAPARVAGVAFSACPVTGARNVAVISAVCGLADRLVAGEVDGDSYRVDATGKTTELTAIDETPILADQERAAIAALARRAELHFGRPQDIEWAFVGDTLYLLQSRPITTLPTIAPADDALTIWDNSNIVESYAGVTSPLTYSFARYAYAHVYRAFSRMMGVSPRVIEENNAVFENMLGRVDGRVYYNLINWYRALALFPGFQANRGFMEEMMGVAEALPADLAREIAPPAKTATDKIIDQARFARVGAGLIGQGLLLPGTIKRFYARLNRALSKQDAAIAAMSASALAAEYRGLEQQLLARWDAPLINDFLCMIAFGASRKAMETWAGSAGLALHGEVMIGQGDIVSAEPAQLIRAMGALIADRPEIIARLAAGDKSALGEAPNLSAAFDAYIAKFGDRCTQELKLESLTLHEDSSALLMAIAAAARTPTRAVRANNPEPKLALLFKHAEIKGLIASWLLRWAKARVRDRENLRFERTRLFGRVRRIFVSLGARFTETGLLDAPRDIFFLTVEEAIGAVEGGGVGQDIKGIVAVRKAEEGASRARPDPPERFETRGAHLAGLEHLIARAPAPDSGGETRKGLACCAGVVTARVRVVEDPRIEALAPGEILVARHTDPGWIAVFANAAGVIAERGSLLSHSAIVAREMGVPCVVALKGVTAWLRTGDLVRLDGGAGSVERIIKRIMTEIAERAAFDQIRYAQLWEDADILIDALRVKPGETVVSIASAGDNALALLTTGAERVIAVDLNPAQLACVRIRLAAWRVLTHGEMLELFGSRLSTRRGELLDKAARDLNADDQRFWAARKDLVIAHGLGGAGKFESYFRIFRRYLLPFVHSQAIVHEMLTPKDRAARERFYDTRWNSWAWRGLIKTFFSRPMMGRFGRDPAFFDQVTGSVAEHVAGKTRQALVEQDPSINPYLAWIVTGRHGEALPFALRAENFEIIRSRIDRLEPRLCTVEALAAEGVKADAFNLSDIFEYMSPPAHEAAYATILDASRPGARIAYWNMMAPRRAPAALAQRVRARDDIAAPLSIRDKAFFYRDFVVEDVL